MAGKTQATNGKAKGLTATQRRAVKDAFASLANQALTRADLAQRHGLQYGGNRDIYKAAGYKRELTIADFVALYARDPIAARLVDMPPEATWRNPPTLEERVGPEVPEATGAQAPEGAKPPGGDAQKPETKFTKSFDAMADRLGLWRKLSRLDRTARLGQYGVLLIGTGADDQGMMKPMRRLSSPDDVLYLQAYRQDRALITRWVTDPKDPRFSLPELYNLNVAGELEGRAIVANAPTLVVHWSHVIHVAEHTLGDEVYGVPALQRPYNALADLMKVTASTAEAFWQRVAGALIGKIDPQAVGVTEETLEQLDGQLKELYHDMRRAIFGQGLEVERLASDEPNPSEAAKLYVMLAAAGEGIPLRMLVGNETGERASTEDKRSWMETISERKTQYAEPNILRPLIDRLVKHAALPTPTKLGYDVVWPEGFQETESEVATANKTRAETAKALTPVGGDPLALVEIDENRNVWLSPRKQGDPSPFDGLEPDDAGTAPAGAAPPASAANEP